MLLFDVIRIKIPNCATLDSSNKISSNFKFPETQVNWDN